MTTETVVLTAKIVEIKVSQSGDKVTKTSKIKFDPLQTVPQWESFEIDQELPLNAKVKVTIEVV